MMDQTPDEIKCQIYSCFLYRRFLYKYRRFFSFQNTESKNRNSFYTWGLQHYQNFMILFLQNLEPISFKRMDVIFGELESVDTIFFFMDGKVDIGYEINRKKKFRIRQKGAFHIGGFECCYKRRSQVIYRVSSF